MSLLTAILGGKAYSASLPNDRRCRKDTAINKDKQASGDRVTLSGETFDPAAVHFGNHADDDVPPYLTLEVDGLTSTRGGRNQTLDLQPDDGAGEDESARDTQDPTTTSVADELDVYGWESTLWHKIRDYFGF